ncbi:hypothetical protein B0I33_11299 [Prauserella shujinwangii]|uniref:Uncharacterized protein n=1 Tax=Prauserella shujinwangii TaxID=1453103 RepID=A0A2T0LMB6_9PSEU|nr:hypothetical protein [Prauserella shujinwangii]PRX44221.1 hypothetical protein B0I33_11299 [Prauserella shujinwangii]
MNWNNAGTDVPGIDGADTVELHAHAPGAAEPRRVRRGRWWRALTGSLAAGLAVVALVLLGAQIAGWLSGWAGPGGVPVAGHLIGAVLALAAQRVADRARGPAAAAAAAGVLGVTGAVLWLFWWW